MLKTPFAGLTQLDPEEPLSLDDFSFQAENPMRIDRLLEVGAVTHRHDAHAALANPSAAPTADSFVGSGTIPGDTTIEFGYTLIDADGGETEVSPIDAVTTPPQIGAPSGAITATADYTAGQLKSATYYYGRTFVDGGGGETPLGAIRAVDVQPGHANARVLLSGLSGGMVAVGAAGWKLYRARDGGNFTYLASGTGNTLTDDGTLCIDCDQNPPEFNTTQSFNRVEVTLPVRPDDAVEWRLYGTVQSGTWDLFSYVASGSGSAPATVALPSFTPTRGRPPARTTALRGASQIDPDTDLLDYHWKRPVDTETDLPAGDYADVRIVRDVGQIWWVPGSGGAVDYTEWEIVFGNTGQQGLPGSGFADITDGDGPVASGKSFFEFLASGAGVRVDVEDLAVPSGRIKITASGVYRPNAKATKSATANINTATSTKITFDGNAYDRYGSAAHFEDANDRLVAREKGLYRVTTLIGFASNATGFREALIKKNNTTDEVIMRFATISGQVMWVNVACDVELNAGDYVEAWGQQTSGGALAVQVGSYLEFVKVSDT